MKRIWKALLLFVIKKIVKNIDRNNDGKITTYEAQRAINELTKPVIDSLVEKLQSK